MISVIIECIFVADIVHATAILIRFVTEVIRHVRYGINREFGDESFSSRQRWPQVPSRAAWEYSVEVLSCLGQWGSHPEASELSPWALAALLSSSTNNFMRLSELS